MPRASKDLAKRLRFDRFPRPDTFRRWYGIVGLILAVGGGAAWYGLQATTRERQYMPGPVSQGHASFGDRCETCHQAYAGVANAACLGCHAERVHSSFEVATPACASCHVEHRGAVFLAVANASCVDCHGALATTKAHPDVQTSLRSFAEHPELGPLRPDRRDEAVLRFNHRLHLSTTKIAAEDKLACASCHVAVADGRLMQPIVFESHCQRCHAQEGLGPDSSVEVVHEAPEVVREDLKAKLLIAGIENPEGIFGSTDPGLPGRVRREPLDAAPTLAAFVDPTLATSALAKAERKLYAPLDAGQREDASSLLDNNKLCFLCHDEEGTHVPGELPRVKATKIPARWLTRGEFSHRTHDLLPCEHCHPGARESAATADVNVPAKAVCERCHVDGTMKSAGTGCMLCHLYHDTSKDPALRAGKRKEVSIEALFGERAP